jgi:hypothetical protein
MNNCRQVLLLVNFKKKPPVRVWCLHIYLVHGVQARLLCRLAGASTRWASHQSSAKQVLYSKYENTRKKRNNITSSSKNSEKTRSFRLCKGKTSMLTNSVLWIRDMIRVVHPGSRFFTYPGSRGHKGTGSRIRNTGRTVPKRGVSFFSASL